MIKRLFPRALLACIGEDRPPRPQELAAMAEKVCREAFPGDDSCGARELAVNVARAALTGAPAGVLAGGAQGRCACDRARRSNRR